MNLSTAIYFNWTSNNTSIEVNIEQATSFIYDIFGDYTQLAL